MGHAAKLALFVGGNADGWTLEINEIQPRLNWQGSHYVSRGTLETKTLGIVEIYVLEEMKPEEEKQRLEIIGKAL